jgi:ABC-type multidrug transport system ATPase subunit
MPVISHAAIVAPDCYPEHVRLRGVSKRYGPRGQPVLVDVDLDLAPGEITAITGGNGSGKSTLLRVLVGASRPSSGTVTGRPRQIGYVPERFPSDERLTARSYLAHMGRLRGLSTRDASGRARDLMEQLALAGGMDTALRRLSKGNLQKVALAQALLVPPRLLVLDEPWSGLDVSAHGALADIMAEVASDGAVVVFTDHRGSVVRTHASHIYGIAEGRISAMADAPQLITRLVLRGPDGDRVTMSIASADADGVLLDALRRGWSVVKVDEPVSARGAG